jgi:predicted GNAT superfamily acetyltransferase
VEIRPLADADVDAVLDLNAKSVEALSPLDASKLSANRSMAAESLVVEVDGTVAAFAIAYGPDVDYESENYSWHRDRFDDFFYLDRIVVGADYRRRGIATALYDAMEEQAGPHGRMVCEVNSDPPNLESLAFHHGRGYVDIGELVQQDGHRVVMLEKRL